MSKAYAARTHGRLWRLSWLIVPRRLRDSEIRWCSDQIQWVVSPAQIALWTTGGDPWTRKFNWNPLQRVTQ